MATSVAQLVNGVNQALVSVADRGLAYGHGVFETMRLARGDIPLWPLHRERLQKGLAVLHIPLSEQMLADELALALSRFPSDGVVKITVTAGSGGRGYAMPNEINPVRVIQWFELPSQTQSPVSLQCCQYRLPANPVLAGIKHLNRLDQVIAATELEENCQGLLQDYSNLLVEGLSHNLFLYLDGHWCTPDLGQCGVEGVMRRLLIEEIVPAVGEGVRVRQIPATDLCRAQEVFICNSVAGILPVSREVVSAQQWHDFERCRRLQQQLQERYPCFAV